jgi:hypothetical protein
MATKKKAGSKSKARKTARSRTQDPFVYTVNLIDGGRRVVVDGLNDGNIYGSHKQSVTFIAGRGVPPFTFFATKFVPNDSKKRKNLQKQWPFKGNEPSWPQPTFTGKLKSPGLFKRAFYKYTISIDGAMPADPIIIIER